MNQPFMLLLMRWSILALGVTVAANVVPGIECANLTTLIVVVVLLSFCNAVLRPLLVVMALPFIVLTLGFGLVLINALLFMLVGALVNGFEVSSFWSALGGSIIVGLSNLAVNTLIKPKPPPGKSPGAGRGPRPPKDDDVIDV